MQKRKLMQKPLINAKEHLRNAVYHSLVRMQAVIDQNGQHIEHILCLVVFRHQGIWRVRCNKVAKPKASTNISVKVPNILICIGSKSLSNGKTSVESYAAYNKNCLLIAHLSAKMRQIWKSLQMTKSCVPSLLCPKFKFLTKITASYWVMITSIGCVSFE